LGDPLSDAARKIHCFGVAARSLGADAMGGVYVPRSPTTGVLYGVVRGQWSHLAADVRDRTDGVGLPAFVVNEFRKFLRCGVRPLRLAPGDEVTA
jgi:hypothetical protein